MHNFISLITDHITYSKRQNYHQWTPKLVMNSICIIQIDMCSPIASFQPFMHYLLLCNELY